MVSDLRKLYLTESRDNAGVDSLTVIEHGGFCKCFGYFHISEKDIGKFLKSNLITNRRSSSLNLILETDSKFFGCFACAFFGPFRIRSKSCCL